MSLYTKVLILNKHFLAVKVGIARDAICALYTGKASVVDEHYSVRNLDQWVEYTPLLDITPQEAAKYAGKISSPSISIYIPRVIKIDTMAGIKAIKTVKYSRHNVYKRDKNECQYCGTKCKTDVRTLDHVHPKSKGGKNSWENIVTSCKYCNSKKGSQTLSQLGWELKNRPTTPQWKSYIGIPFDKIQNKYWKTFL
jgi:5-methylcytosine-specific restriction endonuclease McrA